MKVFEDVGKVAAFVDPLFKPRVVPAGAEHVEAGDGALIMHDADGDILAGEAAEEALGAADADGGVFDFEEFGGVEEKRRGVIDGVTEHREGGEFALAFGGVPDLFDLPGGEFSAIAGGPDVGERGAEIGLDFDAAAEGGGRLDFAEPFDGGADADAGTEHLTGQFPALTGADGADAAVCIGLYFGDFVAEEEIYAVVPDVIGDEFAFFRGEGHGPIPGVANEEIDLDAVMVETFDEFDTDEATAGDDSASGGGGETLTFGEVLEGDEVDEAGFGGGEAGPGGGVGNGAGGEEELVVAEIAAVGEAEDAGGGVESGDPAAEEGDVLFGVGLAFEGFEIAQVHAVHEGVHEGSAGDEIVTFATDDGDFGVWVALPEGEGGGDAGDAVADDDVMHGEGFAFGAEAVTIYYCGSLRYRMGSGGESFGAGRAKSLRGGRRRNNLITRRRFGSRLSAAMAGSGAAAAAGSLAAADKEAKHVCKGMNECKGQGGCSAGENGCAGKNTCKGKGGCQVPMKAKKALRMKKTEVA